MVDRFSSYMWVSMTLVGDCVGSSFYVDVRTWMFSSLTLVVHKLPSREIGMNKGAVPAVGCPFLTFLHVLHIMTLSLHIRHNLCPQYVHLVHKTIWRIDRGLMMDHNGLSLCWMQDTRGLYGSSTPGFSTTFSDGPWWSTRYHMDLYNCRFPVVNIVVGRENMMSLQVCKVNFWSWWYGSLHRHLLFSTQEFPHP